MDLPCSGGSAVLEPALSLFYVFKETEVGFGPFVYERAENPGMEADESLRARASA